jgi:hypothetical protein
MTAAQMPVITEDTIRKHQVNDVTTVEMFVEKYYNKQDKGLFVRLREQWIKALVEQLNKDGFIYLTSYESTTGEMVAFFKDNLHN